MVNIYKNKKKTQSSKLQYIGNNLNFAGTEAYKLLRTNIKMSFISGEKAILLGITSTLPNEGKSTVAINLAYQFAQEGKRVLLLEGDLRLPVLAKSLSIQGEPGLTDFLTGAYAINTVLRSTDLDKNIYMIPAGTHTPNPSELLGSEKMQALLTACGEQFDYVLVDLPPVSSVSDPLVLAGFLSGMVVVTRCGYCEKDMLMDTIASLEQVRARIIGIVVTYADTLSKEYKRMHRYGHYYKYYKYDKYYKYNRYNRYNRYNTYSQQIDQD